MSIKHVYKTVLLALAIGACGAATYHASTTPPPAPGELRGIGGDPNTQNGLVPGALASLAMAPASR